MGAATTSDGLEGEGAGELGLAGRGGSGGHPGLGPAEGEGTA